MVTLLARAAAQSESLDLERRKFEADRKKLTDQVTLLQNRMRGALPETASLDGDDRAKLLAELDRANKELHKCQSQVEAARKAARLAEEGARRKEAELQRSVHRMEITVVEWDELKKVCEGLETKVVVLEMEKKNIQQIEERKYQVSNNMSIAALGSICHQGFPRWEY